MLSLAAAFNPEQPAFESRYPLTVNIREIDFRNAPAVCDLFYEAAKALLEHPGRDGACVNLPSRGRLLATGDLHDNPRHFAAVQTLALLDQSSDHHVTLHELIHGDSLVNNLDLSYRMLCKVARWLVEFPEQVHPLLANHEMCQMTGRGVSKGAGDSVKLFNDGLDYVFGDDSETVAEAISEFISSMPLALKTHGGLLCVAWRFPARRHCDSSTPACWVVHCIPTTMSHHAERPI